MSGLFILISLGNDESESHGFVVRDHWTTVHPSGLSHGLVVGNDWPPFDTSGVSVVDAKNDSGTTATTAATTPTSVLALGTGPIVSGLFVHNNNNNRLLLLLGARDTDQTQDE